MPQCLKIAEKIAFNIASAASYVYILDEQKFIKNAKNSQSWRIFKYLTVLPDMSVLIGQKIGGKCQN